MPAPPAPRLRRIIGLTCCLAALLLAGPAPVHAQVGGSLSLQSDARYRGVSMNDGRPQAQASVSYDAPDGWYGGALLARWRFDAQRRSPVLLAYLGRVQPLTTGIDADAGLTLTHFDSLPGYDYAEAYAGLVAQRWNARISYSPSYFGRGRHSMYTEFGVNWPMTPSLQWFVHAGALRGAGSTGRSLHGPTRLDLRTGAALRLERWEFQLAWVSASRGGPYAGSYEADRRALTFGAMLSF